VGPALKPSVVQLSIESGQGCQNLLCLTLGTDVGCGVVLEALQAQVHAMVMMEQETLLHTESGTPQTLFAATEVVGDQRYSLCRSVSLFEQQEAAITSHSQMALFGCLYPLQVGKTVAPTEQFLIDFLRIGLLTVTNTPIVLKVELPQKKGEIKVGCSLCSASSMKVCFASMASPSRADFSGGVKAASLHLDTT
jgi:hypothetical protein